MIEAMGVSLRAMRGPMIASVLLITSEWLFFATKPSFLSALSYPGKLGVWLWSAAAAVVIVWFSLVFAGLCLAFFGTSGARIFRVLMAIVNAVLFTCLIVLLVDNFTWTLLGIGMRSIQSGWVSALAIVLILVLAAQAFRLTLRSIGPLPEVPLSVRILGLSACVALALLLAWPAQAPPGPGAGSARHFNVLVFGVDALEAEHMGVYGYHRDTTPFLSGQRGEFLVGVNSFTNNSKSFGAIGSMLTGKYPATTRLVYPPNVLTGNDQFEHLPGLLRSQGYRALDMSLRWYADPRDMNLRCGFDEANFREIHDCDRMSPLLRWLMVNFSEEFLLFYQVRDRISERVELLDPRIENPGLDIDLSRVGQPRNYWYQDEERIAEAIRFIEESDERPFFINLHLMGAHGPRFLLDEQRFSHGREQRQDWDTDFYDDAVLRVDRQFGQIYARLEELGKLDETILVFTSDHGKNWSNSARLPLLFRFPEGRHAGEVTANTQRLDIVPTLLDSMGLAVPAWMEGDSLLGGASGLQNRPIIQTAPPQRFAVRRANRIMLEDMAPPFYSIGSVQVVSCNLHYAWLLEPNFWIVEEVSGYSGACESSALTDVRDFFDMARDHLRSRGYAVDAVPDPRRVARADPSP